MNSVDGQAGISLPLLLGSILLGFLVYKLVLICLFKPFRQPIDLQGQHNTAIGKKDDNEQGEVLSPELRTLQLRLFSGSSNTQLKTLPNLTISIEKSFVDRITKDHPMMHNFDSTVAQLSGISAVYILIHSASDEEQNRILDDMKSIYLPSFKHYHRILFYTSQIGKKALLRQLTPKLHLETDSTMYNAVKPHIERTILMESMSKIEDILQLNFS